METTHTSMEPIYTTARVSCWSTRRSTVAASSQRRAGALKADSGHASSMRIWTRHRIRMCLARRPLHRRRPWTIPRPPHPHPCPLAHPQAARPRVRRRALFRAHRRARPRARRRALFRAHRRARPKARHPLLRPARRRHRHRLIINAMSTLVAQRQVRWPCLSLAIPGAKTDNHLAAAFSTDPNPPNNANCSPLDASVVFDLGTPAQAESPMPAVTWTAPTDDYSNQQLCQTWCEGAMNLF